MKGSTGDTVFGVSMSGAPSVLGDHLEVLRQERSREAVRAEPRVPGHGQGQDLRRRADMECHANATTP